ncbi:MAG TPA: glycosyltransferase family 39 protein [Kofleriaceae bacterium]|nr:glycosyltransferase family 39 protein [Kofleriaceae bacterium]
MAQPAEPAAAAGAVTAASQTELRSAAVDEAPPRTRPRASRGARLLRFEPVLVVLVSLAVLVPGIWGYSLVDPWETHYGEVAREMLQDNDFVHTKWTGCYMCEPGENEGFRSKPVLMFWMMAAGLTAVGVGDGGGYSGEMTASAWTMVGIRLPFILSAVAGLTLLWWMLARLIGRRTAWVGLLVVGSTPMFAMIARNAIPDMPMVACTIGALSLFALAVEDGERPVTVLGRLWRGRIAIDARHVVLGLAAGFVLLQAAYYAAYFTRMPLLGVRGQVPNPAIWLPAMMVLLLVGMSRDGWRIVRLPFVLVGGIIAAIVNEPMPARRAGQSRWRHVSDDILGPWDRHALDRYLLRGLAFPFVLLAGGRAPRAAAAAWRGTAAIADRALAMSPITTMRQVYLIGMYFLLGVSLLAKGPPGMTVVAAVAALHVACFWRWRALGDGAYELKRGLLLMIAIAVPWHIAMFFRVGPAFVNEYIFTHILNRASVGVDNSPGTFEHYTSQIGHGMWLWAALLPAALGAAVLRAQKDTREGRVRFLVALWAIVAVAVFCLVQTKFHHYILPAIPPLALVVALFLDDLIARRDRLHPIFAALGAGIALLVCRDLMYEPDRWIEMFVFRYDRPWPSAEPYSIDPSDGVLALGLAGAAGIAVLATRFVRLGAALTLGTGLAICIWALQVYMPIAGTHWGMREASRTYYEQRTIYGQQLAYFGTAQLADDWQDVGQTWSFETFIPDNLQVGQPMTLRVQVYKATDERALEKELPLTGVVTAIGDHEVTLTLDPGERAKLDPLIAEGQRQRTPGRRPPVRAVDADRLLAWHLYWRGELFWSGGEIWAWPTEMKTYFGNPNNVQFQKYLNDRQRAPLGRRYFVLTEAGRLQSVRSHLPTQRARDSFQVLDQTSNKFAIGAFYM